MRIGMVKDAVYYLHERSGASDEKARGVIIGLVSGLMASGRSFEEALKIVGQAISESKEKDSFRINLMFPDSWVGELKKNLSEGEKSHDS